MEKFDVVVIGAGPGGYVAAIKTAQLGLKTALVEARKEGMGGTCLNRGCIPSKTLIDNASVLRKVRKADKFGIQVGEVDFDYGKMVDRKDAVVTKVRRGLEGLIKSNGIHVFNGFAQFLSPHEISVSGEDEALLHADNVIIATGSEPMEVKAFPFDYKRIHDSTSMLEIRDLPKKLVIVGGGVIGCEFASLFCELDVEVTIVELLPTILSTEGKNVSQALTSSLRKRGVTIATNCVVEGIENSGERVSVRLAGGETLDADMTLVSVGRKFNTDRIGLEKAGVIVDEKGVIPTDETMRTNIPHIYAIGDITGRWIYAHVASHQGLIAAENISGKESIMHYNAVPSVIFTEPEIGTIGLTLERAIEQGYDAKLGKFPFQALGKAQAAIETDGFAQIVVEKGTGQILGAQVVGYGASALIAEMAVAIGNELTIDLISGTIHAHPTIAEGWMEAAFAAQETPLHLPPKPRG